MFAFPVLSIAVEAARGNSLQSAALVGGVFYGLAGVNHALESQRNSFENVAMVSDLGVAVVLLAVCGMSVRRSQA